MNKIAHLNTAQTELAITKIENNLVNNIAKNNAKLNNIDVKLINNNDKLNGFQKTVVALDKTVKLVEIKVSKHETEILEFKAKVT